MNSSRAGRFILECIDRSRSLSSFVFSPRLALPSSLLHRSQQIRGASAVFSMDKKIVKKIPRRRSPPANEDSVSPAPSPSRSHATRAGLVEEELRAEKEKYAKMSLKQKRKLYRCGEDKLWTLEEIPTWPVYAADASSATKKNSRLGGAVAKFKSPATRDKQPKFRVNKELNEKISMLRADITAMEIDAIVNAANSSLLGGGGVDGAIHTAAGNFLKRECSTLKGCDTGDAKITCGYKLPAKYVIHTVGPIGEKPDHLQSAYLKSLDLVKEYQLKSVAFPCISTGVYGYPIDSATCVALNTIRTWLEKEKYAEKVERIIFCVFLKKDVEVYEDLLHQYFPLTDATGGGEAEDAVEAGEQSAKGKEVDSSKDLKEDAVEAGEQSAKDKEVDSSKDLKDTTASANNNADDKMDTDPSKERVRSEAAMECASGEEEGKGEKVKQSEEKESKDAVKEESKDSKEESGDEPPPSKKQLPAKE